jgi:prevent-host-death family protein
MTTIAIEKAEKELAALVKRARAGEEIIISDGGEPGIKLQPVEPSYRGRGILKGKIKVSDEDLFAPLPDDELKRWWGEGR